MPMVAWARCPPRVFATSVAPSALASPTMLPTKAAKEFHLAAAVRARPATAKLPSEAVASVVATACPQSVVSPGPIQAPRSPAHRVTWAVAAAHSMTRLGYDHSPQSRPRHCDLSSMRELLLVAPRTHVVVLTALDRQYACRPTRCAADTVKGALLRCSQRQQRRPCCGSNGRGWTTKTGKPWALPHPDASRMPSTRAPRHRKGASHRCRKRPKAGLLLVAPPSPPEPSAPARAGYGMPALQGEKRKVVSGPRCPRARRCRPGTEEYSQSPRVAWEVRTACCRSHQRLQL